MMTLRELTLPEEFEGCLELQREGFGWSDPELMPMRFFVVSRHIGGLVLGAFDGNRLIGFLSAIPGIRDGKTILAFAHAGGYNIPSGFWSRDATKVRSEGARPQARHSLD